MSCSVPSIPWRLNNMSLGRTYDVRCLWWVLVSWVLACDVHFLSYYTRLRMQCFWLDSSLTGHSKAHCKSFYFAFNFTKILSSDLKQSVCLTLLPSFSNRIEETFSILNGLLFSIFSSTSALTLIKMIHFFGYVIFLTGTQCRGLL